MLDTVSMKANWLSKVLDFSKPIISDTFGLLNKLAPSKEKLSFQFDVFLNLDTINIHKLRKTGFYLLDFVFHFVVPLFENAADLDFSGSGLDCYFLPTLSHGNFFRKLLSKIKEPLQLGNLPIEYHAPFFIAFGVFEFWLTFEEKLKIFVLGTKSNGAVGQCCIVWSAAGFEVRVSCAFLSTGCSGFLDRMLSDVIGQLSDADLAWDSHEDRSKHRNVWHLHSMYLIWKDSYQPHTRGRLCSLGSSWLLKPEMWSLNL